MRLALPLLLLVAAVGCADVSGLTDFELAEGGGGAGASGSVGGSGTGTMTGTGTGTGTGALSDDCPEDVTVASGTFGDLRAVDELNTADDEDDPSFTADGLELYFNREAVGTLERTVWVSYRGSVNDPWGEPALVDAVNLTGTETNVVVAPDGLNPLDANRHWGRRQSASVSVRDVAGRRSPRSSCRIRRLVGSAR